MTSPKLHPVKCSFARSNCKPPDIRLHRGNSCNQYFWCTPFDCGRRVSKIKSMYGRTWNFARAGHVVSTWSISGQAKITHFHNIFSCSFSHKEISCPKVSCRILQREIKHMTLLWMICAACKYSIPFAAPMAIFISCVLVK